jgi:two-component system, NarL family, invasion response regulator UvrY
MIRLLIADDHAIFREGLKHILEEHPDIAVADEAGNGQEVLDKVWKHNYDMVLLDIGMPGMPAIEVLKQIKNERPRLPVLVLSMYPEDQYAVRFIRAGASGYLTKESAPDELITAIRKITAGRKYITSSIAEKLADEVEPDAGKPAHHALSDREFEVFRLIASGKTVTEIGDALSLSVKTISTYRTRILEKMKMKTNAELMHYAIKHHMLE